MCKSYPGCGEHLLEDDVPGENAFAALAAAVDDHDYNPAGGSNSGEGNVQLAMGEN